MSNFGRVTITEGETGADAPVVDKSNPVDQGSTPETTNQPDVPPSDTQEPSLPERPQWLPEKFKSPEDLAKAYEELQKKLSQPKQAEEPKKEEAPKSEETKDGEEGEPSKLDESVKEGKVDLTEFHNEWAEKGELTPESFDKLEKMGFPRELVQQYINGFQATQEREAQAIYKETGGEEGYKAMTAWAAQNLSAEEIAAYDKLVTSGDYTAAKIAVKGLYAQYTAVNGKPPKLVSGVASGKDNTQPFRSTQEVVKAMADPRYKEDPAYRKDVEKRLEMSSVL